MGLSQISAMTIFSNKNSFVISTVDGRLSIFEIKSMEAQIGIVKKREVNIG